MENMITIKDASKIIHNTQTMLKGVRELQDEKFSIAWEFTKVAFCAALPYVEKHPQYIKHKDHIIIEKMKSLICGELLYMKLYDPNYDWLGNFIDICYDGVDHEFDNHPGFKSDYELFQLYLQRLCIHVSIDNLCKDIENLISYFLLLNPEDFYYNILDLEEVFNIMVKPRFGQVEKIFPELEDPENYLLYTGFSIVKLTDKKEYIYTMEYGYPHGGVLIRDNENRKE